MKRVIMPIIARDYFATAGRLAHIGISLADEFDVDFFSIEQEVFDGLTAQVGHIGNIHVHLLKPEFLNLTFGYRDELASIFIRHVYNMVLPGTHLKIWDIAAFDDFWGHISNCAYKELKEINADFILLPIMSRDDHPMDDGDVFYTTIVSKAKGAGIKLVGYQLYPVFSCFMLMPRLMDVIIVKDFYEQRFYEQNGVHEERIRLLTDVKDRYSISTIEDSYMNCLYNEQIKIHREELCVAVCNHDKLRPQLKEVFAILAKSGLPIALFLIKREFAVRDLSEDQIIESLYFDDIKKVTKRFFLIESQSIGTVIMISDMVISAAYITPLEFAVRYDK